MKNVNLVCFNCNIAQRAGWVCRMCSGELTRIYSCERIPKKNDVKQWEYLRDKYTRYSKDDERRDMISYQLKLSRHSYILESRQFIEGLKIKPGNLYRIWNSSVSSSYQDYLVIDIVESRFHPDQSDFEIKSYGYTEEEIATMSKETYIKCLVNGSNTHGVNTKYISKLAFARLFDNGRNRYKTLSYIKNKGR